MSQQQFQAEVMDELKQQEIENNYYVYEHIRKDSGKVFYVGKGKNNRAYHFLNRNKHWTNIFNKTEICVNFLIKDVCEEFAFLIEIERINQLKALGIQLANMTDGGEGMSNPSIETLQKLSKARKGRVTSIETKRKLSLANKGRKLSDEHKLKLSLAHKGKPSPWKGKSPSEESRLKMSLAKIGKKLNTKKENKNDL
jgi:hypothetical protein